MKPISKQDILAFEEWERVRPRLRPLFINARSRRHLTVGSHLTFLFENAQTIWYQIEEMLRAEKISVPEAVQHEIDTYNELMPPSGGFSVTMMIAFDDPKERDSALRRLAGLEEHVWLKLGEQRIAAKFDPRQMSTERLSSIQFIKFDAAVGADEFARLAEAGQVAIEIDHPSLAVGASISGDLASALAEDLRSEQ